MLESNSSQDFEKLIDNLNKLTKNANLGVQDLVNKGTEIAKAKCLINTSSNDYNVGSHTSNIKGKYNSEDGSGYITINSDPALYYLEIGTGIVGKDSPHPSLETMGLSDNYGKGPKIKEDGSWVYPKDGSFRTTKGLRSCHFMYDSYLDIKKMASQIINVRIGK